MKITSKMEDLKPSHQVILKLLGIEEAYIFGTPNSRLFNFVCYQNGYRYEGHKMKGRSKAIHNMMFQVMNDFKDVADKAII